MPNNLKTWGNQLQIRVGGNLAIEEESLAIALSTLNTGNGWDAKLCPTLFMGTNVATSMELPSYVVRFDFHKVDYRLKQKK
jgi:hypothetical protein